mmetsp:Transcript_56022/g.112257  ORF Transcript_56022/g.112257 Transcript_56022/m.112257 type:complete len:252 (+) Transcript_56022:45-800(+)
MRYRFLSIFMILYASSASGDGIDSGPGNVGSSEAVRKRRARADAKAKFEEDNGASFDAYGRVIRYGTTADDLGCEGKMGKDGELKYTCRVTESTRRQYLTKEEKVTAKQLQADKQEEMDSSFGSVGAEGAAKKHKFKKEQKGRCRVFEEWLAEYKKDESKEHVNFFRTYLKHNYEDFAAYRAIAEKGAGSKKEKKKAKKLKRHMSLNVHQDKLPPMCNNEEVRDMMSGIMTHLEDVEKCIESPHTCDPAEL